MPVEGRVQPPEIPAEARKKPQTEAMRLLEVAKRDLEASQMEEIMTMLHDIDRTQGGSAENLRKYTETQIRDAIYHLKTDLTLANAILRTYPEDPNFVQLGLEAAGTLAASMAPRYLSEEMMSVPKIQDLIEKSQRTVSRIESGEYISRNRTQDAVSIPDIGERASDAAKEPITEVLSEDETTAAAEQADQIEHAKAEFINAYNNEDYTSLTNLPPEVKNDPTFFLEAAQRSSHLLREKAEFAELNEAIRQAPEDNPLAKNKLRDQLDMTIAEEAIDLAKLAEAPDLVIRVLNSHMDHAKQRFEARSAIDAM